MKIIKCAYSKTFPISQYFEKIFLEAEINEGDDVRNVLYDLKRQVSDFFYESNKAAEKQTGVTVKVINEAPYDEEMHNHNKTYTLEEQINSCTLIKILETYKFIVKGKPELEAIYNNRLKELT